MEQVKVASAWAALVAAIVAALVFGIMGMSWAASTLGTVMSHNDLGNAKRAAVEAKAAAKQEFYQNCRKVVRFGGYHKDCPK